MGGSKVHPVQEIKSYFYESLNHSILRRNRLVSEEVTEYLAGMLASFARSEELFRKCQGTQNQAVLEPVSFQYFAGFRSLSALESSLRFKMLGDECLFLTGFLYDFLRKDGYPQIKFHEEIGSSAYARCGLSLQRKYGLAKNIYSQLSAQFSELSEIIGDLHLPELEDNKKWLRVCQRWQETRDERYASLLKEKNKSFKSPNRLS